MKYEIKSVKFLGLNLKVRNRKILNKNWIDSASKLKVDSPISILFLAKYPQIKGINAKLLAIKNWDYFACKLIYYSVIEAYFTKLIGIVQFEDEIKIVNGLIDEKIKRFVIIPSEKCYLNLEWFDIKINDMAHVKFNSSTSLPFSNLKEQISFIIGSILKEPNSIHNPQKEFSKIYIHNQTKEIDWINIGLVNKKFLIFDYEKEEVEFKSEVLEFISNALEIRLNKLDKLIKKNKFIERFCNRLEEVIEEEFSFRTASD